MECYYKKLNVHCYKAAYHQQVRYQQNPGIAQNRAQLIVEAYEFVIDQHERDWCDSHWEEILQCGLLNYNKNT